MGPAGQYIPIPTSEPSEPSEPRLADRKWYEPYGLSDRITGWWEGTSRLEKAGDIAWEAVQNVVDPGISELGQFALKAGKKYLPKLVTKAAQKVAGTFSKGAASEGLQQATKKFPTAFPTSPKAFSVESELVYDAKGIADALLVKPQGEATYPYGYALHHVSQSLKDRFDTLYKKWAPQYPGKTEVEIKQLINKRGLREDIEYKKLAIELKNLTQSSERSVEGLHRIQGRYPFEPGTKGQYEVIEQQPLKGQILTKRESGGTFSHELAHHQDERLRNWYHSKFQDYRQALVELPAEVKKRHGGTQKIIDQLHSGRITKQLEADLPFDYKEFKSVWNVATYHAKTYSDPVNMRALLSQFKNNLEDAHAAGRISTEIWDKLDDLRLKAYETAIPRESIAYSVGWKMSTEPDTTFEKAFGDTLKDLARGLDGYLERAERLRTEISSELNSLIYQKDAYKLVDEFKEDLVKYKDWLNKASTLDGRRELLIQQRMEDSPMVARLHDVKKYINEASEERINELWEQHIQEMGNRWYSHTKQMEMEDAALLQGGYQPLGFGPEVTPKLTAGKLVPGSKYIRYEGLQTFPPEYKLPNLHQFTDLKTGSTFSTKSPTKQAVRQALDELRERYSNRKYVDFHKKQLQKKARQQEERMTGDQYIEYLRKKYGRTKPEK